MKKHQKRTGIWIPKELMENTELDWTNKALLAEIQSLHNNPEGCFASNEFFSDLLGLGNASSASKRISKLKRMGYITTKNVYGKSNCVGRIITPTFKKAPSQTTEVDSGFSMSSSKKNKGVVPETPEGSSPMTIGVVPLQPGGSSQTPMEVVLKGQGGSSDGNTINTSIKTHELKQEINTDKLLHATRTQITGQEDSFSFTLSELKVLDGIIPELPLEEYRVMLDPLFIEEKNWSNDLLETGIYIFLKITKHCHRNDEANISIIKCYYKLVLEKHLRESRRRI
jgi:hypothetical protein